MLTLVVAASFMIPARYTFPPLGAAGRLDLMLGLALLGWWVTTRAVPSLTVRTRQPLRWLLLILVCSIFVSAALAYQTGLSATQINGMDRELFKWLSISGVVLVAIDGIRSHDRADALLKRTVLFGLFIAFVADLQFFFGVDLTFYLQPPGLSPNLELNTVELRSVVARVYGTSLHPIEFGVLMSVVGAVSAHYALTAQNRVEQQWRWICTAVLVGSGLLSISRSAVVSLAVLMGCFFLAWRPRMWFNGLVVGLAGLVAMRVVAPGVIGTLRALFENLDNDPSIAGRTQDYEVLFPMIEESFWFGIGPGTFNPVDFFFVDNQWLLSLVAAGFLSTMALAVFFFGAIAQAHHLARRSLVDQHRHRAHTLMAVLIVFIIVSALFDSLAFPQISTFTFVVIGTVGGLWSIHTQQPEPTMWARDRRVVRASRSMSDGDRPRGGRVIDIDVPPAPLEPGRP